MKGNEEVGLFGILVNAFCKNGSDIFPADDANDLINGAEAIPGEVTDARRAGKRVVFIKNGSPSDWYWQMPDGSHVR